MESPSGRESFARGYQRQNQVESRTSTAATEFFFALFQRAIIDAWHHISQGHLPGYASQFALRWHTRHDADGRRLETFARWIEGK
jgi:hypothetical protein